MARNLVDRIEANQNAPAKKDDLRSNIERMEQQFAMAMPRGMEAAQLVRDAITCLKQNPKLAQCEQVSVLGSLMTCAQLGLRPGVLGHAWLLPFWDGKGRGYKAQLVIGYQGLVELAHRSGKISSLIARTVYENDVFDVDYGLADNLVHKPALKGTRGDMVAFYAIAKFTTGGHAFWVMTYDEMIEYRQLHAKARNAKGEIFGPWVDNFEGMALKTTVRQLSKWMPKSTDFARAIEADEAIRVDLSPDAIDHPIHVDPTVIDSETVDTEPIQDMPAERSDGGMFPPDPEA
ncbi:recombination protein RecT [Nocardia otitidiscaviarum]|uniref:recombination protein RecT n=1 Tax=Nocardia otitidiscaviarum TaxID=1823 RepID=UPI0004A6EC43|nr:recombination protein RecT [Nocardia otitidiscaviarum]